VGVGAPRRGRGGPRRGDRRLRELRRNPRGHRGVVQRAERNEQLGARSAARLVENELAVIGATLAVLRKKHLDAASLSRSLRRLPRSAWTANQQSLARTLNVHDWGNVSESYVFIQAFEANPNSHGDRTFSPVTIGLFEKLVRDARDCLLPYQ
jgi:hypothetical protein